MSHIEKHYFVRCDVCGVPRIEGLRRECTTCPHFNVCDACWRFAAHEFPHWHSHAFRVVPPEDEVEHVQEAFELMQCIRVLDKYMPTRSLREIRDMFRENLTMQHLISTHTSDEQGELSPCNTADHYPPWR